MHTITKKKIFVIAVVVILLATAVYIGVRHISSSKPSSSDKSVHLTEYSKDDGPTATVILTGAIGDFGNAVSVHHNGTVNPDHNEELNLELSKGSFRLNIADLGKKVSDAFSHLQVNPNTCSGNVSVSTNVPIISGSGTGSYKGVAGGFNVATTIDEIVPMKQHCDVTAAFLKQAVLTTGTGTISFH